VPHGSSGLSLILVVYRTFTPRFMWCGCLVAPTKKAELSPWGYRDLSSCLPHHYPCSYYSCILCLVFLYSTFTMSISKSPRLRADDEKSTFQSRVSFDTFDNKDASDFSLTLNSKHKDYTYTRDSRTFLCGTDQNDYSNFALEWLIDELVDDGDEIVCLRVVEKDSKVTQDTSIAEGAYRKEAKQLLDQVIEKNTEGKAISIILEFAVGKVQETIQRMVCAVTFISSDQGLLGPDPFLIHPTSVFYD
jgi:Universal stress protein family